MKVIRNYIYLTKKFLKYGKKYIIFLFMITLISPVATIIDTLVIKRALDAIETENPIYSIIPFLCVYILCACFLYIASALFVKFSSLELIEIGNRMNKDVFCLAKSKDYVNTESSEFYDSYSWTVQGYYSRSLSAVKGIASFFTILLTIIAIVALIATVDWVVILFSIINVLSVVLFNIITRKLDYNKNIELLQYDRSDAYIRRTFYIPDFAADIRITGLCGYLIKKFDNNKHERVKISKRYLNKTLFIAFFIKFIPMVVFIVTIMYLISKTAKGTTSYGDFALLLTASQNLTNELLNLTNLLPNIVEQGLYAQKMIEFEALESHIETSTEGIKFDNVPPNLSFKNVSFKYAGANKNAITNFTFEIKAKQKIAIVGKNGAGKSTIVKLLLRLYDPSKGDIFINGINLKDYSINTVRNAIGLVMQNSNLYALTLKENILINDVNTELTDDILSRLFSMVDLKHPAQGFSAPVTREFDDNGMMFSGGEKQKISLLRTMAHYYPLVVLDEPTSSLDPISEEKYIDAVYNSFGESTVVMIAHRLSTIRDFDNIIVVDEGNIIESGSHEELMKKKGLYYDMYTNQAKRYGCGNE